MNRGPKTLADAWHEADEREAEQTLKREPLDICERLLATAVMADECFDNTQIVTAMNCREAKAIIEGLVEAAKRLSFAAQTSGGTAGRDDELVAAIEQTKVALEAAGVKP